MISALRFKMSMSSTITILHEMQIIISSKFRDITLAQLQRQDKEIALDTQNISRKEHRI